MVPFESPYVGSTSWGFPDVLTVSQMFSENSRGTQFGMLLEYMTLGGTGFCGGNAGS